MPFFYRIFNRKSGSRELSVAFGLMALGVVMLAVTVRCVGIRHGSPIWIYHPDVAKQAYVARDAFGKPYAPAVNRFKNNAHRALYPYGDSVLLSDSLRVLQPVLSRFDLDRHTLKHLHVWQWAFMLRILSVTLFAVALFCFVIYAWSGSPWTAVLPAALLLAFEPLNAQYSHYGMNDVPLTALLMLLWLGSPAIAKDRASFPWRSLLLGLLMGVAFGVKYQAVVGAVLPGMVWLCLFREKSVSWRVLVPLMMGAGFVAGALYACPPLRMPAYFLEHFPDFMAWQANITEDSLSFSTKLLRNLHILGTYLVRRGYGLLVIPWLLFWIQAAKGAFNRRTLLMGISGGAFSFVLLLIFLCTRDFLRSNDLIALTPFWIWPVGYLLGQNLPSVSSRSLRLSSVGTLMVTCLLLAFWFRSSWLDSLALRRPDTRELARNWAVEHLHTGDRVLYERYTVPTRNPDFYEARTSYLTEDAVWPQVQQFNYDYLVSSSLAYSRFDDKLFPSHDLQMQDRYRWIQLHYQVVTEFSDREMYFAQPRITIYTVPR